MEIKETSRMMPWCVDCLQPMKVLKKKGRLGVIVCVCSKCKKQITIEVED